MNTYLYIDHSTEERPKILNTTVFFFISTNRYENSKTLVNFFQHFFGVMTLVYDLSLKLRLKNVMSIAKMDFSEYKSSVIIIKPREVINSLTIE